MLECEFTIVPRHLLNFSGGNVLSRFEILFSWRGRSAVLPALAESFTLTDILEDDVVGTAPDNDPSPISAFLCVIDYAGETRLINCRRYDGIGDYRYVGGICHTAKAYRQFRTDRIDAVYDAQTGEQLGSGSFFERFALDDWRERAPTWGLNSAAKSHLIAGLNILAFMARCDGHWHGLEVGVIEQYIIKMWIRKNWPGDPDIADIVAHTERLAPDADVFFRALARYAADDTSLTVIRRAIGDLIAADGRICPAEMNWAGEVEAFLTEFDDRMMSEFVGT